MSRESNKLVRCASKERCCFPREFSFEKLVGLIIISVDVVVDIVYSLAIYSEQTTKMSMKSLMFKGKQLLWEGCRAVASLTVPGGQEFPLSSFSPKFHNFSSNFSHFLPHFGSPGGRLAHPGRPWLRHWRDG